MKNRTVRVTIIIIVLVMALVGYYAYLSNRSRESRQKDATMTAVEATLSRDLNRDYPPTPKEVMRYYNDIIKCFYNEECTEDQIESLGLKARELYDQELRDHNEIGTYLIKLQEDVQEYRDANRRITSTSVAASTNVDFYDRDGFSFARLLCTYNLNENGQNSTMRIIYLLRKDADKRWMIYGWDFEENVDLNGDGVKGD